MGEVNFWGECMNIEIASKLQKRGIILHRVIFVAFLLQRITLQLVYRDLPRKNTIALISFIVICAILEELLSKFQCFNNIWAVRVIRFVQCAMCSIMIIFTESTNDSGTMVMSLLLMFVVDMFLVVDVSEKTYCYGIAVALGIVVLLALFVRMTLVGDNKWMFMFFAALLLGAVFVCEALAFSDYIKYKDNQVLDERRKFENIVEKNENILNMQNKLRNTNDQLNIQKIDLQRANKQIKEANEEMKVQEEIMRYIASSFDVPKISNQITDSIMSVKKLGFCAVYIKEGVYHNKHSHFVVKTKMGNLEDKIREQMDDIYSHMVEEGSMERIIHDNPGEQLPYLKDVNINSIYIKVLGENDDKYGLFMIGDSRRKLFDDNMSFYNAIIAQYDIAISNARIYNNMQHMARKDGLTQINNRIYFNELFKETARKIVADKGCMSVALFDIDKFKNVNDTYGHLAGDEVIKRIASVTEEHIEEHNDGFVCRYGGEEFVAVLPNRDIKEAEPIIQELFEKLCSQIVTYNEFDIPLSVSVGLTAYPEVCDNTEELLKRADWCMYYAKEHGRHQLKVDDGTIVKE